LSWLEIDGLQAFYRRVQVLHNVSLSMDRGGFVAVIGSNGAGKTTLLRSLSRMVDIKGSIRMGGREVDKMSPRECVRQGIIHCPEGRLLFPAMSVQQNLMMGAFLRQDRPEIARDLEKVMAYLPILAKRCKQMAGTLSGGEQQMLAVGRAIMGNPSLLTLDEPSFGLAPLVVEAIFDVVKRLNQDGVSVLLVEQNAALSLEYSTYAYVLEEGKVNLHGPSQELRENPAIARAYLGMG
jgi:branched-chain amino acid transport system ATP-binding protein